MENFVSSLSSHSFLYEEDGNLFSFGENNGGQLGFEGKTSVLKPKFLMKDENIKRIVCGYNFTMIEKLNGDLFSFGDNKCNKKKSFIKKNFSIYYIF